MPDEPVPDDAAGLRAANARLRGLLAARDAEAAGLRAELHADRELIRRLGLRFAELERRLDMDSGNPGTPSSKERIGAKEARRTRQSESAARTASGAGSPVTREKACSGTRTRARSGTRRRRRSAVPARHRWTGRRPRSRGGRRSSTWSSSGM